MTHDKNVKRVIKFLNMLAHVAEMPREDTEEYQKLMRIVKGKNNTKSPSDDRGLVKK